MTLNSKDRMTIEEIRAIGAALDQYPAAKQAVIDALSADMRKAALALANDYVALAELGPEAAHYA